MRRLGEEWFVSSACSLRKPAFRRYEYAFGCIICSHREDLVCMHLGERSVRPASDLFDVVTPQFPNPACEVLIVALKSLEWCIAGNCSHRRNDNTS